MSGDGKRIFQRRDAKRKQPRINTDITEGSKGNEVERKRNVFAVKSGSGVTSGCGRLFSDMSDASDVSDSLASHSESRATHST